MLSPANGILLFFLYSLLGWCAETVYSTIREGRFVNRGFLIGPAVPMYGFCAVLLWVFFEPARNNIVWLLLAGCAIYIAVEYIAGYLMENHFHAKWWDYGNRKHTIKGYVWIDGALVKGAAVAAIVKYAQPLTVRLLNAIPSALTAALALILVAVGAADLFISYVSARKLHRNFEKAEWFITGLRRLTRALGLSISERILTRREKHLRAAFPRMRGAAAREAGFARGICATKLFMIFLIASMAGCLIEFCFVGLTAGRWMSRSSLLYGPFSVVWGLGAVLLTVVLHPLADKADRHIVFGGMLLGGAFEYICSMVTELLFGKVFWDYSKVPFNLNGRVNLLFCVFWGMLALGWIKGVYPRLSRLIERIPGRVGRPACAVAAVLLILDALLSCGALYRMQLRQEAVPARNAVERFLDQTYPDSALDARYPNMVSADAVKERLAAGRETQP